MKKHALTIHKLPPPRLQGTGAVELARPRKGSSPALNKAKSALESARKGASKAREQVRQTPMQTTIGFVAGNVVGLVAGDMVHERAKNAKDRDAYIRKSEHVVDAGLGLGAAVLGGALLFMGKGGDLAKIAGHTLMHAGSHMEGEARAIQRLSKDGLTINGADSDPFDMAGSDTGASIRQQRIARRQQAIKNIVNGLAAEGNEVDGLEEYVGGLLEDTCGDINDETGLLPAVALIQALSPAAKKGLQTLQAQAASPSPVASPEAPITGAVLDLEGLDSDVGASARRERVKAARKESRQMRRDTRKEARKMRHEAKKDPRDAQIKQLQAQVNQLMAQPSQAQPIIIQQPAPQPETLYAEPLVLPYSPDEAESIIEGLRHFGA